ncbi:hypothetical protein AA0119_g5339 [Alternaria tenuissima]|uniref:Uncharacterized protein n=1 Tax=Alternaria tenuissima TaxID=119927 RepID=A0ABY0GFA9_9PLEO|nr:hypothetical protein AA0119_g5339 [Alternaria tenuissima]RYO15912.1 hypothetical protein AA0121_g6799 [Alternaria tenuissima]
MCSDTITKPALREQTLMISCELLEQYRALDIQVSQSLHHRMHIGGVGLFHMHEVLEIEVPLLLVFNPIFITIFLSGIPFKKPPTPHRRHTIPGETSQYHPRPRITPSAYSFHFSLALV